MDLSQQIQKILPAGEIISGVEKLFGEASYREYFRVRVQPEKSYVLMKLPPGLQSVSEEITNYEGPAGEIPFLNIARYLEKYHLPSPKVEGKDLAQGLILLQDLGDQNLEKLLKNCNEAMRLFFYKSAIDLLLKFQKTGIEHPDEDCMAFKRSFDKNLLEWEFDHFLEFGIEDRFSIKIPQASRIQLLEMGRELVKKIVEIPFGLTHRDFQSRNLILYGYEFYLIDFQDALLGPVPYDLVALLRDSYVNLSWENVEWLIDQYLEKRKKMELPSPDRKEFFRQFHLITVQRKLKDAGRFQYIHKVKKNSNFLPHVPASLGYVKNSFEHLAELNPLQKLLGDFVPELK